MKTADVVITDRVRKHHGIIDSLVRSIEKLGVLQPIGVTPDNQLVFGYRRLMACKQLGIEDIPARVIDINLDDPAHLLRMEQDENNQRADFTPSEKVEIARRIEEALAGRHGNNQHKKEECLNLDTPNARSDEAAASAVGWKKDTYRKAKAVVESGDADLVEAMDKGDVSVHKAHETVKRKNQKPKPTAKRSIRVILAYEIAADANAIIIKAGSEYATKLALEILRSEGHEVQYGT